MCVTRFAAALMLAALPAMALAAPDHDPVLEEAAIRLVVEKIGPLRGGFRFDQQPEFNRQQARNKPPKNTSAEWQDGIAPARELAPMTTGRP